jgi:hypothetical protein
MHNSSKIVVFDMDETLGYYMELGMFWDALNSYIREKNIHLPINQELFNKILDLYPEFLRPNIISILNFLKNKKCAKHCNKLMINTNNQGPLEWAQYIKRYFENKIKYPLFDQVINAFKVNGKHIEICRTTHMKTHKDFIRCAKVPETTEICFIDDVYHPGMIHDNIYYINIKPYTYDLSFDIMIERFINSGIINICEPETDKTFTIYILNFMKRYNYTFIEKTKEVYTIDKILSKKILHHLHVFFSKTSENKQTTYKIKKIKNKTKKIKK